MNGISHFSIPADNPDRAKQFYESVFGWSFRLAWEYDTPQGREGYWEISNPASPDAIAGGMTKREYPTQPIQVGIEVQDIDGTLGRLQDQGGSIIVGKMFLPQVGWFAMCADSEGNTFAVYQRNSANA